MPTKMNKIKEFLTTPLPWDVTLGSLPLGQESVIGEEAWLVFLGVVISVFGLAGVGCQQHRGFWGTVDFIIQDAFFHL